MNVTCNKCGKRYVIADDKVAGKSSVKIRCKQCQNLIAVGVGGVSAAPAAPALASSPSGVVSASGVVPAPVVASAHQHQTFDDEDERTQAMPSLDMTTQWFAMVGGKQIGPLDLREMMSKVSAGEISMRTYVWKPGMGDWKRASDVPEVSPIFASVSSGATATGQGQAPAAPKKQPAPQRDVAVANEMPSPELSAKPAAASPGANGNGHGNPVPARRSTGTIPFAGDPAALNDLFKDMPGDAPGKSSTSGLRSLPDDAHGSAGSTGDAAADAGNSGANSAPGVSGEAAQEPSTSAPIDPFAALSQGDGLNPPPPGEATKFFIAQAGVNKRNPPWKIALFVGGFLGLPIALLYALSTLHVLPPVTTVDEHGNTVEQSWFSPEGFKGGLSDILSGDKAKREALARAEEAKKLAAAQKKLRDAVAAKGTPKVGDTKPDDTEPPPKGPSKEDELLKELYGASASGKKATTLKIRDGEDNGGGTAKGGGVDDAAAGKVVADNMKAFQSCIEQALHRNPNLAVGSVTLKLNVGSSGTVKSVNVEPAKWEGSDWAGCMANAAKRIHFPPSDQESEIQVPLKVGVNPA